MINYVNLFFCTSYLSPTIIHAHELFLNPKYPSITSTRGKTLTVCPNPNSQLPHLLTKHCHPTLSFEQTHTCTFSLLFQQHLPILGVQFIVTTIFEQKKSLIHCKERSNNYKQYIQLLLTHSQNSNYFRCIIYFKNTIPISCSPYLI